MSSCIHTTSVSLSAEESVHKCEMPCWITTWWNELRKGLDYCNNFSSFLLLLWWAQISMVNASNSKWPNSSLPGQLSRKLQCCGKSAFSWFLNIFHHMRYVKFVLRSWRGGSAEKGTSCSSRASGSNFQCPHGRQLTITCNSSPRGSDTLTWPPEALYT